MKNIINILFSLWLISCVSSCVETEPLNLGDDTLMMESEINPNRNIEVTLKTTQIKNQGVLYPGDAKIFLSGTGLENSELGFTYIERERKYKLRSTSFRVQEGGEYSIKANIPGSEYPELIAQATIPYKSNFKRAEVINKIEVVEGNMMDIVYEIEFEFEESDNRYFHFIPSYSIHDASSHTPSGISEIFRLNSILDNRPAVYELFHRDGLLIDREKLEDNKFTLRVSTLDAINTIQEEIGAISVELRAAGENYYNYNYTRSKQLECSISSNCSEVTDYSNVENGLGVLGGYTAAFQEFKIK